MLMLMLMLSLMLMLMLMLKVGQLMRLPPLHTQLLNSQAAVSWG